MPQENDSQRTPEEIRKLAHQEASEPIFRTNRQENEAEDYNKAMRESGPYLTLGIQMAVTILIAVGVGYWIDKSNNTSPLWTTILSATGCVLGLAYFLITVLRLSRNEETKRR